MENTKVPLNPFLENKMSDANREQISTLLYSVWNSILADISKSRGIPATQLNQIADGLLRELQKWQKPINW
jgi:protease-4